MCVCAHVCATFIYEVHSLLGYNRVVWVSRSKRLATADADEESVLSCKWNNSITKDHMEKNFVLSNLLPYLSDFRWSECVSSIFIQHACLS